MIIKANLGLLDPVVWQWLEIDTIYDARDRYYY